jgi:antitoxin VapB
MNRADEVKLKFEKVQQFLDEKNLDAVLLGTNANFSWLTAGGDDHLEIIDKTGSAMIFVTKKEMTVIANNNEIDRLKTEAFGEVASLFNFEVPNWYDPQGTDNALKKLGSNLKYGADVPREGARMIKDDFASLRYDLTEAEIERFRWLGQHTAAAVEAVAHEIVPGMTEHEIEAAMSAKMLADDIFPTVLLIATDERIFNFRHPIPSEKKLDKYAHLVLCARRWGLVISFTRCVYFGQALADLKHKQEAAAYVDAVFMSETKPGAVVGRILDKAKDAYAQQGFPNEWQHHHQGGLIGYEPREYIAFSESTQSVRANQAFGWNPTVQGTKSEDSILVKDDGLEILTLTTKWPAIDVEIDGVVYPRPAILER